MKYKIYLLLMMTCSLSIGAETKNLFDRLRGIDHLPPEEIAKIKKNLDAWEEDSKKFVMPDYSKSSTPELYSNAISYSQGAGPQFKAVIEELEKRPEELKNIIQSKISIPLGSTNFEMLEIPMLVTLAGYVDLEFQIEIAKKTLFRKKVEYFDPILVSEPFILNILKKSKNDESEVLERLIEEGRIIKGAKIEKQWSVLRQRNLPKKEGKVISHPPMNKLEAEPKNTEQTDEETRVPWIIAGILTLGTLAIFCMKGKSSD